MLYSASGHQKPSEQYKMEWQKQVSKAREQQQEREHDNAYIVIVQQTKYYRE
jgi:hypothetical protein